MTIFAKIIAGEIPAQKIYEDDICIVIPDIAPQKPLHWLAIPKKPIVSLSEMTDEDDEILIHLFRVIKKLMKEHSIPGYSVKINVNKEGGQEVFHLHIHILASKKI
jgi:histidine triad (HIT) family protein